MIEPRSRIAALALTTALAACSTAPPESSSAETDGAALHTIYVIRRDQHSGIALSASLWRGENASIVRDFPRAQFLEFGWGDADYYQADAKTSGMTLAAALWPTSSVMEVLGYDNMADARSTSDDHVELKVSERQVRALTQSIADSFAGEAPTPTGVIRRTRFGESRFYRANGAFHFFRMCNRWTAERLQSIGCTLRPWPILTASRALNEARRCAQKNQLTNGAGKPAGEIE